MKKHAPISDERKALYYGGAGVMAFGFLLFISNFFLGPLGGPGSMAARAIGGMLLMMAGAYMRQVGARGAAGSGLILDPEKAREDLKPWAHTAGGLVKDALDQIQPDGETAVPETIVKVRCPHCRELNDEDARYCKMCGKAI